MKRLTHKQIVEHWVSIAKESRYLWEIAAKDILRAVQNKHRAKARNYCLKMASKYQTMAISGYYSQAAKQLK